MVFLAISINWRYFMKVVLVKSPKIFSGFLRMIFKIKKESV
ncbi:MAG: stage V sporulation protein SpoVM [Ruminococcaceae bacterium]|nr:stage V sporulation protein SpoVM [Oscillospiraceae bacterium]